MPDAKDFRYGSLINYHFYKDRGPNRTEKNYWAVGYVVHRAKDHIKVSVIDPNKVRFGVIFSFSKKLRLDNIIEFTELQELPSKKP